MKATFMLLSCVLAGTALSPLSGCVKNAATGKSILTFGMSKSEQVAMGAQAAPQFTQEMGGRVDNAALQSYVNGIGMKLKGFTEADNPSLPWEFNFVNTDQVNAFALPGGKVFFTRGLASQLTTEAQMAGVIGHEIGHVTAEHGAQRIAQASIISGGVQVAGVLVGSSSNTAVQQAGQVLVPGLNVGGQLVLLKYGRKEELEADKLGVRYMTKAGYNPRGQLEVMQLLQKLSQGSKQPEFLSTHPDPAARIQQVQELLRGEYASTQGNPQYQDFADRYKAQFLDILKTLPPAPKPKQAMRTLTPADLAALGVDATAFDLGDPTSWCAHCRAAAEHVNGLAPSTARGMLASAALHSVLTP